LRQRADGYIGGFFSKDEALSKRRTVHQNPQAKTATEDAQIYHQKEVSGRNAGSSGKSA
jgi:hypothetical protein